MPTPSQLRALKLLVGRSDGCPEGILLAHGVSIATMIELVKDGLATAQTERVRAGSRVIEVAQLTITRAGLQALG